MMNDIAAMSMSMSQASLNTAVSTAMTKKAMDVQEIALEGLLEMIPEQPVQSAPAVRKGQFIDVYA